MRKAELSAQRWFDRCLDVGLEGAPRICKVVGSSAPNYATLICKQCAKHS